MADVDYTYSIQNDFPNHKVATDSLAQQIQQSAIVTALDYISTAGDNCDIWFKAELSAGDITILNGIVAAHTGVPLPNNQPTIQAGGATVVAIARLMGTDVILTSHDFCRRTTWFWDSVRVTNETLTDSGDGLTFTSAHTFWIDMTHGYVMKEAYWAAKNPDGYAVVITSDGVLQVEREAYEVTGGDYTVDYDTGAVTFFASQTGKTVVASYNYENGSTFYLNPDVGTSLVINEAEIQFAKNVDLTDTIRMAVYGWVQVFAPQLWDGYTPPGPLPTNTLIELTFQRYLRIGQMIDEARGAYPVIPAVGGSRGTTQDTIGFPYLYEAAQVLDSSKGMQIRVLLEHNRPLGGERATSSFYILQGPSG